MAQSRTSAASARRAGLEPVAAEPWAYRRRARLSVRFVEKKGGVLVGFTERRGQRVAELRSCEVLHPSVGRELLGLRALIGELAAARHIPQIEVAAGDSGTAVVIRHLKPLSESDRERLCGYAERERLAVFSQPGGAETITRLWPLEEQALSYRLPGEVEIQFQPNDFIQVNAAINRALVATVVDLWHRTGMIGSSTSIAGLGISACRSPAGPARWWESRAIGGS